MNRPDILDRATLQTIELYRLLDTEIFVEIARLLSTSGISSVEQWHMEALAKANMLDERVADMLANVTGQAHSEINAMFDNAMNEMISQVDSELAPLFGNVAKTNTSSALMHAFRDQSFLDIDNFVSQTLINTQFGPGVVTQMFQTIINQTTANFINGNMTLNQSIENTILSWSRRGVPTVFIDRGGNTWSLERYVDMVLRSNLNRTYNEVRMARMRDYGVHTALVSSLMDSAPRCRGIQGQVIDTRPVAQADSGFPSLYSFGYPAPDAPFGINCRHSKFPFIPGINENNQPHFNDSDVIERNKQTVRQRELENRIRQTKKEIIILEELNSNSPRLPRAKNRLDRHQGEIGRLINNADHLSRNPGREKVMTPRADLIRDAQN